MALCLVARLLGEAARGDVEPTVAHAQSADERSNRGSSHSALAMLDLGHDARRLEPQCVGRGHNVATAVGSLGHGASAVTHGLEEARHKAFHVFPVELDAALLDELDAVVIGGCQRFFVVRIVKPWAIKCAKR